MKLLIGLLVAIIMIQLAWMFLRENAVLAQPTFEGSLLDKYHAQFKDFDGMTYNDYILQKNIRGEISTDENYRFVG